MSERDVFKDKIIHKLRKRMMKIGIMWSVVMLSFALALILLETVSAEHLYYTEKTKLYFQLSLLGTILLAFSGYCMGWIKFEHKYKDLMYAGSAVLSGLCWLGIVFTTRAHWGIMFDPDEALIVGMFLQVVTWSKSRFISIAAVAPFLIWTGYVYLNEGADYLYKYFGVYVLFYFTMRTFYGMVERLIVDKSVETVVMADMAMSDSLTGIPNRRAFDSGIEGTIERAKASGVQFSLAILDIDHFKQYNDTYGHKKGDDCLTQVAQVLRSSFKRSTDIVARIGGEEFAIILPETSASQTKILLEKARRNLHETNIPHEASLVSDRVTFSIGVATSCADDCCDNIFQRADEHLYMAKSLGRNQIA